MTISKYMINNESSNYQIINLFPYLIMEGYNFEFDQRFRILIAPDSIWA